MKLKLIRQYQVADDKAELLFEIDGEFLQMYREWSGDYEVTEEGFSRFMNERIEDILQDEEWKND
jgi:hypothetical protein